MHGAAPLLVAGVPESLAVPDGSTEVHLHADVAAVGEPLRLGVVAPGVARPGTAVHVEHGRQAGPGHLRRKGHVAVDGEPVPGGERERLHRRERVVVQRGHVREQERQLPGVPVVDVVVGGPVRGDVGDQPPAVGAYRAGDADLAAQPRPQRVDLGAERGVEVHPPLAVGEKDHGLRLQGLGIRDDLGEVVVRVLGQDGLPPRRQVHPEQPGRVRADAGGQIGDGPVAAEAEDAGGGDVLGSDLQPRLVRAGVGVAEQRDAAAVVGHGEPAADPQVAVDEPGRVARVGLDLLQRSGGEVVPVDVVQLGVVRVEPDQHGRRVPAVVREHHGVHVRTGCDQLRFAAGEVERVEPPVLVALGVLQVHQGAVVMAEGVRPYPAVAVVGHRPRLGWPVRRADPHVEHPVLGGHEAELRAVGRQRRAHPLGVAEQDVTGDEGNSVVGHTPDSITAPAAAAHSLA